MEYRKECPACEHNNPQLEKELDALAQLLFDAYLEDCGVPVDHRASEGIDNTVGRRRLKGVDANHLADA